jgi:hypothetical protein
MAMSTTQPTPRGKTRRWRQFSLGSMLIATAACAALFAWWLWQPFLPSGGHCMGPWLMEAKHVHAVLQKHPSGSDQSQHYWAIVDDAKFAELSNAPAGGQPKEKWAVNCDETATEETEALCFRTISGLGLRLRETLHGEIYPAENLQEINGSYSRVFGGEREFTMTLVYEGKFPQGHLLFLQPYDADYWFAYVYDVTP